MHIQSLAQRPALARATHRKDAKMRLLTKAAAGVAAVALLAGCGTGAEAEDGNTTVEWWTLNQSNDEGNAALDQAIVDFEAANPDITIKRTSRAVDAHKDALRTAIGTSAAPDIYDYWAGPGLGGELVNANASADLTEYYEQYGWDERFSDAALAPVTQYGGYHGVPWKLNGEALFYNKKLFAEAGVTELPTTLEELNEVAKKLDSAGITPIQFGGTVNWHVMRLLDTFLEGYCGSETFDALVVTGEANWGEEECVTEAFDNLQTWGQNYFNKGFISINNDESSALFFNGKAAMALEGDWFNAAAAESMDTDDVGVFALPTGTNRLYGFEQAEYVTKDSENKDAATKFLDYLMSDEVQQEHLGIFAVQSVNANVEPSADTELEKSWNEIFSNAEGLYMNNDQNLSQAATGEYWRIQNLVVTGELDPAQAGAEIQKFLDSRN
jgi:raffinose/stachyose/melibiose transport system substrate-binding protein